MTKTIAPLRILAGLAVPLSATAQAEPSCDARYQACNSTLTYCPDTRQWIGPYGSCPSLWVGPYQPGGLQPGGMSRGGGEDR
jgi:hypothetical protein